MLSTGYLFGRDDETYTDFITLLITSTNDEPVYHYLLVKSLSLFDLFEVTMGQPHLQISFAIGASLRKFPHQACRASFDARFTD
jgi:hypothetical protein